MSQQNPGVFEIRALSAPHGPAATKIDVCWDPRPETPWLLHHLGYLEGPSTETTAI